MKKINLSIQNKARSKAQGMVEFALALPILLLLVFGVIEFGRLMQSWLALENGARFAVRYAITGNFDPAYCSDAAQAVYTDLGFPNAADLRNQDAKDGQIDCRVPDANHSGWSDWEEKSNALQDWARLLSIREAALSGATGIAWDSSVSGNYSTYQQTRPTNIDSLGNKADLIGIPSAPDFFNISICSDRVDVENSTAFSYDPNPHYYTGSTDPNELYPTFCYKITNPGLAVVRYNDDAGGPGNRVRITLTYRHTLITPFMSSWWPTLRLTSNREGVVEKFRASRVTGLTGGISAGATYTPVPSSTPTNTPTALPADCSGTGGVLLEEWDNILPRSTSLASLTSWPDYVYYNPTSSNQNWIGFNNTLQWPQNGSTSFKDDYGLRLRGRICPPYTGKYTFYLGVDDTANFYLNTSPGNSGVPGSPLIAATCCTAPSSISSAQSAESGVLTGGMWHEFEILFKEGGSADYVALGWKGVGLGDGNTVMMVEGKYLSNIPQQVKPPEYDCAGTGPIFEYWNFLDRLIGLTSGGPSDLAKFIATVIPPLSPYYPNSAYTPGLADSYVNKWNLFGTQMRAELCAPYTGDYTFYIASDDASELYLSTDTNPPGVRIARVDGYTSRSAGAPEWFVYPGIQNNTVPIHLDAGGRYYIQAFHTDGTGDDNLAVGWKGPYMNGVSIIPGKNLYPKDPRPTPPPDATCDDVVPQKNAEQLYLQHNGYNLAVPLKNLNLYNNAKVTQVDLRWYDSVTIDTLNAWHNNTGEVRPQIGIKYYQMYAVDNSTGGSSTVNMRYSDALPLNKYLTPLPGAEFAYNEAMITQGTIFANSPSEIRLVMTRKWRLDNNTVPNPAYPTGSSDYDYYYGKDFQVTVTYNIGTQTGCKKTFQGISGPVPNGPSNTWWRMLPNPPDPNGKFNIQAFPASPDAGRSINTVYFSVYRDSDNKLVHTDYDSSSPYCLFQRSTSSCLTNMATFVWNQLPAGSNQITAGAYTLVIQSRDNGGLWTGAIYQARIIDHFTVAANLPAPTTAVPTTPVTPSATTPVATTPVTPSATTPVATTPVTPTTVTPSPTTVTPTTETPPPPTEVTEPPCGGDLPGC